MHKLIRDILNSSSVGDKVVARGWVRTRRDSKGGFSFIELNDGSCFKNLQIIANNELENYDSEILKLQIGSSISVTGELKESPGGKQAVELEAKSITVYGFCADDYPLQKNRIGFEKLREIAHLRPRTNAFGAVNRMRNTLSMATHNYFQDLSFYYLNTPIITASDCEGAGEMFRVSTLNPNKMPRDGKGNIKWNKDFFGREASLTVSGQLAAETHACALGRVYTFGPTFRAENSNTSRHLAEFWMVEPEMAFADLNDDADLAEGYLKYCIKTVLEECQEDLAFFNQWIEKGLIDKLTPLVDAEYIRISYADAVKELEKAKKDFEFPVSWGIDLQSEHERYLTEDVFNTPVIVTDYPKDIKAFYMRLNDDEKTVRAMDVLLPRIGEIIGGSQREERQDVLERRIVETGMEVDDYWWYIDLRRFGTVPHAGFGLGFERLVQFCTGMANIRDVIPFPRTPKSADF